MSRTRPRGFAPWRPQQKTMDLLASVNAVLDDYRQYLPLTIRQVFYSLVGTVGYLKTETAYKNLAETLNRARRAGLVRFDHLRDDGVTRYEVEAWSGAENFLTQVRDAAEGFRLDRQGGQEVRLLLMCEAAGMAPMLARFASGYGVLIDEAAARDDLLARMEWS